MLFNSFDFLLFFLPLTIVGFAIVARFAGRRAAFAVLVFASFVFYSWDEPALALLLAGSISGNILFARALRSDHSGPRTKAWLLALGVVFNLALLGYFKYAGFLVLNLDRLLDLGLPPPEIVLPIGISFFTFQQIALLSDCRAGTVSRYTYLDHALFVSFFPQLVAGPIVHYSEMMPQFQGRNQIVLRGEDLSVGFALITIGLLKKVVLADNCARLADRVFGIYGSGAVSDPVTTWLGTLAFGFQVYFDFSGYTDMAMGAARCFGIRLPVNFLSPYRATSVIDFWRRWHITLSRFLRDYLYFPLGGNRKGPVRRYLNLMLVMLLGGLWHGANWTFVAWGGLHGILLMINHAWRGLTGSGFRRPSPAGKGRLLRRLLSWGVTFTAITFAWVPFRAPDIGTTFDIWAVMILADSQAWIRGTAAAWHDLHDLAHVLGVSLLSMLAGSSPAGEFPRISGLDTGLFWCIASAGIALFAPNTVDMFRNFAPVVETVQGRVNGATQTGLTFQLNIRWAVLLGLGLVFAILHLTTEQPFVYFRF